MENQSPRNTAKRARLVDVAREASVSVQAASLVMSGKTASRIPEATRARIQEAAKRVGYAPNRLAQAMKSGKTGIIAIWFPLDRPTANYLKILQGISQKAKASGYRLMMVGLDNDAAYSGKGDTPDYWPVDGVIALDAGKAIQFFRSDPRNDSTPVLVLAYEQYPNSDSIGWDVYTGMLKQVERTIAAGRTDIVHLSPAWILKDYPREMRRRGYTEAMTSAGLVPKLIEVKTESSESAEQAMAAYLAENPMPQAVFGFLDNLAIGAARAILAAGGRIPEDCWVVGVGDSPEAADYRVPISSLRVPIDAVVDQTWEWLMSRIEDTSLETRFRLLEMEFIERESTRS